MTEKMDEAFSSNLAIGAGHRGVCRNSTHSTHSLNSMFAGALGLMRWRSPPDRPVVDLPQPTRRGREHPRVRSWPTRREPPLGDVATTARLRVPDGFGTAATGLVEM